MLAVGAGGGLFGHFYSLLSFLFSFSLALITSSVHLLTVHLSVDIFYNQILLNIFKIPHCLLRIDIKRRLCSYRSLL